MDIEKPMEWIIDVHARNLFTKIRPLVPSSGGDQRKPALELSLAEMQRMKLLAIQFKLVGHAKKLIEGNCPASETEWQKDLSDYVQAVQEHDYMLECSTRPRDPFSVRSTRTIDHEVLRAVMSGVLPADDENVTGANADANNNRINSDPVKELRGKIEEYRLGWESKAIPMVGTRSHNRHSNLLTRLFVAAIGAAFLVGPMWLMMLNTGFYTALIATTVFITAFGIMMACALYKSQEVLAGTLAYAAVLVVFVGLVREPA